MKKHGGPTKGPKNAGPQSGTAADLRRRVQESTWFALEVEIDLWKTCMGRNGSQGSRQAASLTVDWKMNGRIKRARDEIGNTELGHAPNRDLEFSNTLNPRGDLQDGHQMTVNDAAKMHC